MKRYSCFLCTFFRKKCTTPKEKGACRKFFPSKIDALTTFLHKVRNFSLEDILLLKDLVDKLLSIKLKKVKLNLEVDQEVSFMYHSKEVKAKIEEVHGAVVIVKYDGERIRLLKTDLIL